MVPDEKIDVRAAHEYFSKHCFNSTWDLIDKEDKTEKEFQIMIHTAHASVYHWLQRAECTDQNLSIGYWLLSRVYAAARQGENALRNGEICLQYSQLHGVAPLFLGYAYEALARACALLNEEEKKAFYLEQAREIALTLPDADREQLSGDLADIG